MKSVITYEPTGRRIDLAATVDGLTFAWLESLMPLSKKDPVLRCGGCRTGLTLRHDRSDRERLHGVHITQGSCPTLVVRRAAPMTDAHKNACEYTARAGVLAGLSTDTEVTTTGRTIVDVVIEKAGFEIQHSGEGISGAVGRTRRSMSAGLSVVTWFSDRPTRPVWYGKVPSFASRVTSWDELPPPRSAGAVGPQVVVAARCAPENGFHKCPRGNRRHCGKFHEKFRPWPMLYDDLAVGMATGTLLAAQTGKHVRLLSPESVRLYEELTGRSCAYAPGRTPPHKVTPAVRVECERPVIQLGWSSPAAATQLEFCLKTGATCDIPACYQPGRPYAHGTRCDGHKPQPYLFTNRGDGTA